MLHAFNSPQLGGFWANTRTKQARAGPGDVPLVLLMELCVGQDVIPLWNGKLRTCSWKSHAVHFSSLPKALHGQGWRNPLCDPTQPILWDPYAPIRWTPWAHPATLHGLCFYYVALLSIPCVSSRLKRVINNQGRFPFISPPGITSSSKPKVEQGRPKPPEMSCCLVLREAAPDLAMSCNKAVCSVTQQARHLL